MIRGKGREGIGKVRNVDGEVIEDRERVMERWREYFSSLSAPDRRRANITCWGMEKGSGKIQIQEGLAL